MTNLRTTGLIVPLVLLAGLTTGCGGSDDQATGAASAASTTKTITIEDFAFDPVMATASRGDTLSVKNVDGADHTLTADDGSFDTGTFASGSKTITLDEAGSFSFHCEVHTYMKGTIEVSD